MGVVFSFFALWLSSWTSVVLVLLSISDDSPKTRAGAGALLAEVRGEGSGDNDDAESGVLDPGHSETGDKGGGTVA